MKKENKICPVCFNVMQKKIASWSFFCNSCHYWSSSLIPDIGNKIDQVFITKDKKTDVLSFLDSIRITNFNKILDKLSSIRKNEKLSILDVGCGTGLFIKVAKERGHQITGLEPNPIMAKNASIKGYNIIKGFFPSSVPPKFKYDLIIFNDVLEHVPNLDVVLSSCSRFLNSDGLIVISLPNSDGLFFRLAKRLYKVGFKGCWHRLWQKMFYTPHLHYFNKYSLDLLFKKYKYKNISGLVELESIAFSGLWQRLSIDKKTTFFIKLLLFASVIILYPLIKITKRDNFFSIYTKDLIKK